MVFNYIKVQFSLIMYSSLPRSWQHHTLAMTKKWEEKTNLKYKTNQLEHSFTHRMTMTLSMSMIYILNFIRLISTAAEGHFFFIFTRYMGIYRISNKQKKTKIETNKQMSIEQHSSSMDAIYSSQYANRQVVCVETCSAYDLQYLKDIQSPYTKNYKFSRHMDIRYLVNDRNISQIQWCCGVRKIAVQFVAIYWHSICYYRRRLRRSLIKRAKTPAF